MRQFDRQRDPDVAILLDLWLPNRPLPEHLENVELAVSFAATVVADTCRKASGNLLVQTTAGGPGVRGPASPGLIESAMETLAVAEAAPEDRLADLLSSALAAIEPGTEVILVSSRAVDLSDRGRFAKLWDDPARRALARAVRVISAADEALGEYFQVAVGS